MRTVPSVALVLITLLTSCTDLSEYFGDYGGGVVGADDRDCSAGGPCSFIRRGFPEGTQLTITAFRPPPTSDPIGTISTTDGTFDRTALELIVPLEHDQLSLYTFPGGGRLRSYIFAARPTTGGLAGRDVMVFVSLMEDDSIEARIISGAGDEARGDYFGLFELHRQ